MKRYIILFASIFAFSACNNEEHSTASEKEDSASVQIAAPVASNIEKDPVCDMEKDGSWTEFTVHEGDTVWFCSETCKTAFEGNLAKYKPKG
jgi:YHS domain-containing protein